MKKVQMGLSSAGLLLAVILLCLFLLPTEAQAASENDLSFALNYGGESYFVSDCNTSVSGELVIPATYAGKPVTAIDDWAFVDCTALTSVTIPDSVTSIGKYAFDNCTSLTSVTIGNGVTHISYEAFSGCTSLTNVAIGNGVTGIGDRAFSNCSKLTSITIPNSVTTIGNYAFWYCTNLTSVAIPDSVTHIGDGAFTGCDNLQYSIYDNAKYLGNDKNPYAALVSASTMDIASCIIHPDTRIIGASAFDNCTNLISVTIPDSVTSIGYRAFSDCSKLTSITIPDSVAHIGVYAFTGCDNLQYSIYDNAKYLGNDKNPYAALVSASTMDIASCIIHLDTKTICEVAFNGCSKLTSITIPDSVTHIGDGTFTGCDKLTSITIPDSVTCIGEYAFTDCSKLTSITIPDSVTRIGEYAFAGCSKLTSITIPDSVAHIEEGAFYDCAGLTSVSIGNSVTRIGNYAFTDCTSLSSVHYLGTEAEKNEILIDSDNEPLINAIWHYETVETVFAEQDCYYCTECDTYFLPDGSKALATVVFKNWDGTVISSETYPLGAPITPPANPTKAADSTYVYTFAGWDKEVVNCAGDAVYTATYTSAYKDYTVVFKDWDGTVLSTNTYHFLDDVVVPTAPTRESDNEAYDYVFVYWDNGITPCIGDAVYTAVYARQTKDGFRYSIDDGNVTITAYTGDGGIVKIPETIEGYPVTTIGSCVFEHRGDIKVIYIPESVTRIEMYAFSYECMPLVFFGGTVEQADEMYIASFNSFSGWHYAVTDAVFGDRECCYCAHCDEYLFEDGTRVPAYVFFYDWDGTLLHKATVYYKEDKNNMWAHIAGDLPIPEREMDDAYEYRFNGWSNTLDDICTGNMQLTAEYTAYPRSYKITFQSYDGRVLSSKYYTWGEEIVLPTAPQRPSDNIYAYTFAGWDKEVVPCAGETVYMATFISEYIDYTVRFWVDDQVISEETYHWGEMIVVPSDPVKEADHIYRYTFVGWRERMADSCEGIGTFQGCTDYIAVFSTEPVLYKAIWKDWDGRIIYQTTITYGSYPDSGPEDPVREPDNEYTYTFFSWVRCDDGSGDLIYVAEYSREQRWYLVTFRDWNGNFLAEQNCYWGDDIYPPVPYRPADDLYTYTFVGWDQEVAATCTGDATYTATYTSAYIDYTVVFKNWDGSVLSTKTYHWGENVTAPTKVTKAADNTYTYTFAGWDKTVVACAGNATYTATYTSAYINYTVVFKNWDGSVLSTKTYHWGENVTAPANPTRAADDSYSYTFTGWDNAVVACNGNAVYTAVYSRNALVPDTITSDNYDIEDGTISKISTSTTVADLLENINESEHVKVYSGDQEVSSDSVIGTGMVVKVMDGDTEKSSVTAVVTGDTSGDGNISIMDFVQIKSHLLNKDLLEGAYGQAADTNGDGNISIMDFVNIKAHLLGKSQIQPQSINTESTAVSTYSVNEPSASAPSVQSEQTPIGPTYTQLHTTAPEKKRLTVA